MKTPFVVVIFFVSLFCGPVSVATQPDASDLNWDLSADNRIERVHWPAKLSEPVWVINGPATVRLKIRDGSEHNVTFNSAQVWRVEGRVRTIRFIRDSGTVKRAYQDAIRRAAEWGITDRTEIETFKNTNAFKMEHGGDGVYGARTSDPPQARQIEIRHSFNSASKKPYLTVLVIGCGDMYYPPAATQPATTSPSGKHLP